MPTRKYWAATLAGIGTLAVMLLTGARDIISDEEIIAIIGFIIGRGVAYLVPNEQTPGGVPIPD